MNILKTIGCIAPGAAMSYEYEPYPSRGKIGSLEHTQYWCGKTSSGLLTSGGLLSFTFGHPAFIIPGVCALAGEIYSNNTLVNRQKNDVDDRE